MKYIHAFASQSFVLVRASTDYKKRALCQSKRNMLHFEQYQMLQNHRFDHLLLIEDSTPFFGMHKKAFTLNLKYGVI